MNQKKKTPKKSQKTAQGVRKTWAAVKQINKKISKNIGAIKKEKQKHAYIAEIQSLDS